MNLKAQLEGKRSNDEKVFLWDLVFKPVVKSGVLAVSNRWTVSVNRVTEEIVFDRNGLYIRTRLTTVITDVLSMGKCEKAVVSIFCDLLRAYPEGEYVTVSMEFLVDDDDICQYLLTPILTANFERFTVTP